MSLSWPELLDALEERTRRTAALLAAGGRGDPVPDVALSADGPCPLDLELRLRALLLETRRLEVLAERRLRQARTAMRYGQV